MITRTLSALLAFALGFIISVAARSAECRSGHRNGECNDACSLRETHAPPYDLVADTDGELSDAEIRRRAAEAYVWGWPLVYVQNTAEVLRKVPAVGRAGGMPVAPINELAMLTDYISPATTTVACPNQDVIYGFGLFELDEPVVVQVPDFGDRFWLYQLGDARTDGFASLGKVYGTKPGAYLVVGPDWRGDVPAGIEDVLRSPTRTAYCVPRVFLDDTADDRVAVQPLVNQVMAYPARRYFGKLKTCDWKRVRWDPKTSNLRGERVVPAEFFNDLAKVLDDVRPAVGEEARYAAYRRLLAAAAKDARIKNLLVQTALETEACVMNPLFEFRNIGVRLPNHWSTITNGAAFGTDYLTRAAVAKSNVFVNRNNETKYYYQDLDAHGLRLDGSRSYRITFAAGKLPPAAGFWSLTLYNERHGFHDNDLKRYSLGTKNKGLRYNADGSLTIIVQHTAPAAEEKPNWLPAPKGTFSLYLRAYAPESIAVEGAWTPPAVVAVGDAAGIGEVAAAR